MKRTVHVAVTVDWPHEDDANMYNFCMPELLLEDAGIYKGLSPGVSIKILNEENIIELGRERIYKKLEEANNELHELRESCPHHKTEQTLYEWRTGSLVDARVCSWCHKLIEVL